MSSVMDSLLGQLMSGNNLQQIGNTLGVDESQAGQAVSTALPMLIAALGKNAASPEGAQSLSNALAKDHDGSVLNDITGFLSSGGNPAEGSGILGHVLGSNLPAVEQGLGNATGLPASSMGSLLTMLAPLVMGGLGQQQQQQGLDASGIANLLMGESAQAQSNSTVSGLSGLLDMNNNGTIIDDVLSLGSKLLGGLFGGR